VLGVKLWGNLDCRTVDALLLEVAEAHGTARNEAPVFGREAGTALSLPVSSGDPRRERIGITEAARSLELNDKAHDPIAKLENVLFCRWSGGGMPAIRREARLLRHNPLSMPMSGSLIARRVPLTLSVMLVLNGFLLGSLRLLTVGSREALGFR
jgi:hypothetical protein